MHRTNYSTLIDTFVFLIAEVQIIPHLKLITDLQQQLGYKGKWDGWLAVLPQLRISCVHMNYIVFCVEYKTTPNTLWPFSFRECGDWTEKPWAIHVVYSRLLEESRIVVSIWQMPATTWSNNLRSLLSRQSKHRHMLN